MIPGDWVQGRREVKRAIMIMKKRKLATELEAPLAQVNLVGIYVGAEI